MTDKDVAAYLERNLQVAEEKFREDPCKNVAHAYGWLTSAVQAAIDDLRDGAE